MKKTNNTLNVLDDNLYENNDCHLRPSTKSRPIKDVNIKIRVKGRFLKLSLLRNGYNVINGIMNQLKYANLSV